jgi:sarcosine oxidase subunit gamma
MYSLIPRGNASVAETAKREAACPESWRPGRFGAENERAGITFTAHANLSLVDLRGDPREPAFLAGIESALGTTLPLKPKSVSRGRDCEILWLGPDEWLIAGHKPGVIGEGLAIAHGAVTDVSSGRAAWRISGPRSTDLLAKGCRLDLHPRVFASDACAQTALAHVAVLLHRRDAQTFDIYCARSYASHVWHWLREAASEFAYKITTPLDR